MNGPSSPIPRTSQLVFGGMLVYLLLAALFAQERLFNSDCSLQLYRSVNDRGFFFQEARFGMFITQVPLVAGVLLKVPMVVLVQLYSLGLAGTYAGCAFLAHRVFHSPAAALAILLALVIGVGDSFYHATTETHLALALAGLFHAVLDRHGRSVRRPDLLIIAGLVALWSLFTHPTALFLIGFITLFLLVQGRVRPSVAVGILLLAAVHFGVRLLLLPETSYDGRQYGTLLASGEQLSHFFDLFPVWFIGQYLEHEYLPVLVLMACVLLLARPYKAMLFTVFSAILFWALTILTFHEGSGEAMMEKSFMPGIFMFCVPFAELCYRSKYQTVLRGVAAILLVFGFHTIMVHGRSYTTRLDTLAEIIREHGDRHPKMLVDQQEIEGTYLHFSEWATSLDALMLSRCMGPTPRTVFIDEGQREVREAMTEPDMFLYLPWQPTDTVPLNRDYFELPPGPYHHISVDLPARTGRFEENWSWSLVKQ